jgi:hypothetical protein
MPIMKPFTLEAALAGAKVVNRFGIEVTQLRQLNGVKNGFELCGVCGGSIKCWTTRGTAWDDGRESSLDLFMAAQTRTGWINIYPCLGSPGRCWTGSIIYDTEKVANAAPDSARIACIKIEWEE